MPPYMERLPSCAKEILYGKIADVIAGYLDSAEWSRSTAGKSVRLSKMPVNMKKSS